MTSEQPQIAGVNNVGLRVGDLDRSLAFYQNALGLTLAFATPWMHDQDLLAVGGMPDGAMRVAALDIPGLGATLNLIEFAGMERRPVRANPQDPGTAHVSLRVPDVSAWVAHLRTHGYEPLSPPRAVSHADDDARIVFFADPDGFFVELVQRQGR